MCHYFRFVHTCHCLSRTQLQRCRPAVLANQVCKPLDDPPTDPALCCPSFAPCFDCIEKEAHAESLTATAKQAQGERDRKAEEEEKAKARKAAEMQAKKDRIKREHEERAAAERQMEEDRKMQRKVEMEKARKDGGLWIDAGSARKKGGRLRGVSGSLSSKMPLSAPPALEARRMGDFMKDSENVKAAGFGGAGANESNGARCGGGGRAGVWGKTSPKSPQKILGNTLNADERESTWRK